MFNNDVLFFASNVEIDVTIRIQKFEFFERIFTMKKYVLIMKIKRTLDTNVLILNEQKKNFDSTILTFFSLQYNKQSKMWCEENWTFLKKIDWRFFCSFTKMRSFRVNQSIFRNFIFFSWHIIVWTIINDVFLCVLQVLKNF